MFFDPDARPADIAAPQTADDVGRRFGVTILTFVEQPALEELGVGTVGHASTLTEVALSYTFWRNPADHDDPVNLVELDPVLRAELDRDRPELPGWLLAGRHRMRFPAIWEAVRTTLAGEQLPEPDNTASAVLVHHVNHVLMNAFRDERVRGGLLGEVLGAATERALEHEVPVRVNGRDVDGVRLDTDAHVFGLAAHLGDRILSAVIPREHLDDLELAFTDRR